MVDTITAAGAFGKGNFMHSDGTHSEVYLDLTSIRRPDHLEAAGLCFARTIKQSDIGFDLVFTPSIKLIHLATATTLALWSQYGLRKPFASRDKPPYPDQPAHIGEPLQDKQVALLNKLDSTGTYEACEYVKSCGGTVAIIVVAIDYPPSITPAQIAETTGVPVLTIVRLEDFPELAAQLNS